MNGKHYEHRILPQLYNVIEARDSMSCASFRSKEVRIRSRDNFIGLWLDDREYEQLYDLCRISGLTTSSVIRKLITGVQLQPRPPDEYAALLRELSAIGNNINQITHWANARKSVSEPEIKNAVQLVQEVNRLVKEKL